MNNNIFYKITACSLPQIFLCDTANIKPPYIHFKRQAQEYIFYYIHSGELHIREDRREYLLTEGDYILLDPEFEHEGLSATRCSFTYIHFTLDGVEMLPDRDIKNAITANMANTTKSHDNQNSPEKNNCNNTPFMLPLFPKTGHIDVNRLAAEFNLTLSKLLECIHDMTLNSYIMGSLLCELFAMLSLNYRRSLAHSIAADSRAGGYVITLRHYLSANYNEEIDSAKLEEMFHCNFDYLNRVFKKETGDTIFSTLSHIRIRNAKKYLATGLYTCNEVATKCGFHDAYYFSKVFKKLAGCTPTEYRKNMN